MTKNQNLNSKYALIALNTQYFSKLKENLSTEEITRTDNRFLNKFAKLMALFENLMLEMTKKYSVNEEQDEALQALINSLNPCHNSSLADIELALNDFKKQFKIQNRYTETLFSIAATIVGVVSGILAGLAGAIIGFGYGLYQLNLSHMLTFTFNYAIHGFRTGQELILGTPRTIVKTIKTINPHLFWKEKVDPILTFEYQSLAAAYNPSFYTELLLLTDAQAINILMKQSPESLTTLKTHINEKLRLDPENQRYHQSIADKIIKIEQHRQQEKPNFQTSYTSSFK